MSSELNLLRIQTIRTKLKKSEVLEEHFIDFIVLIDLIVVYILSFPSLDNPNTQILYIS